MKLNFVLFFFILKLIYAIEVTVNWNDVVRVSKTTPTLQIVVNPKYRRESNIHNQIYQNLKNLNAKFCRYNYKFKIINNYLKNY